jgi:hypothetical protein
VTLADALGHTRSVIRCAHDRRFRVRRAFALLFASSQSTLTAGTGDSAFQPTASHLRGLPLCRSQAHDRRFGRPHVTLPFPRGSATSAALMFPIPPGERTAPCPASHCRRRKRSGKVAGHSASTTRPEHGTWAPQVMRSGATCPALTGSMSFATVPQVIRCGRARDIPQAPKLHSSPLRRFTPTRRKGNNASPG